MVGIDEMIEACYVIDSFKRIDMRTGIKYCVLESDYCKYKDNIKIKIISKDGIVEYYRCNYSRGLK